MAVAVGAGSPGFVARALGGLVIGDASDSGGLGGGGGGRLRPRARNGDGGGGGGGGAAAAFAIAVGRGTPASILGVSGGSSDP